MRSLNRLILLFLLIPTAAFASNINATIPDKPRDANNPWICSQTFLANGAFTRRGIGHLDFCEAYGGY